MKYDFKKIEKKWQNEWVKKGVHEPDLDNAEKPFYNLMMFPYPSAEGLHVGNVYAFTGSDVYGRYQRMRGNDVFEPIGLDGFGIHSENYAMKVGMHPASLAKKSAKRFYEQLENIGNSFAWKEKVETYSPEYYRWTQWVFLELFKNGLAYRKKSPVNWCPSCKTVLADEQVLQKSEIPNPKSQTNSNIQIQNPKQRVSVGVCERCDSVVEKKDLEQWFFRITNYAPRLLKNLETIDWSEKIKIAQKNWIGESEGALIKFEIRNSKFETSPKFHIEVFTTRPDTIFGATFIVISPEIAKFWIEIGWKASSEVQAYVKQSLAKPREERTNEKQEKTGVNTGVTAVNPANKKEIPVWVADYVLSEYGTGAIMAVPAHDERDFDFAKKFKLPIQEVVLRQFGEKKKEAIFRDSVTSIISRPDNKILVIYNRKTNEYEIPGGGRDGNEDDVITLKREIQEETGYTDFEIKEYLGQIATNFFALGRNEERTKHQKAYYVVLKSENRIPLKPDFYEDFEPHWMTPEEAIKKLDSNKHIDYESEFVKRFLNPKLICYTGEGELVNSGKFDGLDSEKAKWEITKFVGGKRETRYRLRDWLISRQRYWGPPIPVIFCENCKKSLGNPKSEIRNPKQYSKGELENPGWIGVPEKDLPVELPYVKDFRPKGRGESPLASAKSFVNVKCPKCGSQARRETDVSDTFFDSSWYFFRYLDPKNKKQPFDKLKVKRWLPVHMYIGGAEHSVLHLLYTRFITMVLKDLGYFSFEEPFTKFRAHGLIIKGGAKMSKSKGNVVNPDFYLKEFGADALRTYLMFLAPFEDGGDFQDRGILGPVRFLERVWNFSQQLEARGQKLETPKNIRTLLQKTIQKVARDIETLNYNTALSALMILLNEIEKSNEISWRDFLKFIKLLNPFAPHLAQEIWDMLGNKTFLDREQWPVAEEFEAEGTFRLIIQINGKVRDTFDVPTGILKDEALKMALQSQKTKKYIPDASKIKNVVFVPNRILNIVV